MSINQTHGNKFENYIKKIYDCNSSDDFWDIPSFYDKYNIPTSIKTITSRKNPICLADARKFWAINEKYRIIVGVYVQCDKLKVIDCIYEFIISQDIHKHIIGNISYSDIENFHNSIKKYCFGEHKEARRVASIINGRFYNKSIVKLNPKIDSKKQRRLQCSIKLQDLLKYSDYKKHVDTYKGFSVKFAINSSKRFFLKSRLLCKI